MGAEPGRGLGIDHCTGRGGSPGPAVPQDCQPPGATAASWDYQPQQARVICQGAGWEAGKHKPNCTILKL